MNNERLISLISSYHTLADRLTDKQKVMILNEVDEIMYTKDYMNYSAISQYFMVFGLSNSLMRKKAKNERLPILKCMLDLYINNRHNMYKAHGYSNMILQVISDNYSHKRTGSTGNIKIEQILQSYAFKRYDSGDDIEKDSFYLLPDKGDKKIFIEILKNNDITFKWSSDKQGKMPDAYLQTKNGKFIIEHKNKKESGGGQSSQNVEVVDFVKNGEKNVSYVTFMDGPLFNSLTEEDHQDKKTKTLLSDIMKYLKLNPLNYFVNTRGFIELIKKIAG